METLSFAFGVLTMFAIILIIAVVVGIVKVYKQGNQIINLENALTSIDREIHQRINNNDRELDNRFSEVYQELNIRFNECQTNLSAYTDTRIDKLDAKLSGKTEKQLLKN